MCIFRQDPSNLFCTSALQYNKTLFKTVLFLIVYKGNLDDSLRSQSLPIGSIEKHRNLSGVEESEIIARGDGRSVSEKEL